MMGQRERNEMRFWESKERVREMKMICFCCLLGFVLLVRESDKLQLFGTEENN